MQHFMYYRVSGESERHNSIPLKKKLYTSIEIKYDFLL